VAVERRMSTRLPVLDGLRAAAILLVMISHAGLEGIVPGGFGVTIFFFLSGYLITTLMVVEWSNSEQVDLRGFYLRRAVRIIPPMIIAIFAAVFLSLVGLGKPLNGAGLIWDLLFLSNYAPLFGAGSNLPIPLWSLAVEEHFYLLFPILFIAIRIRARNATVAATCAVLCVAVLLIRIWHVEIGTAPDVTYYWSHTRIDSILFGCILATWNNPATGDRSYIGGGFGYALLGAVLIALSLAIRDPLFRDTWRYTVQGCGLFFLFNYALRGGGIVGEFLSSAPLRIVADLSYFLYLIHFPLLVTMKSLPVPPLAQYAVALALAFLFAVAVRHFVELPLLRWRKSLSAQPSIKVSSV